MTFFKPTTSPQKTKVPEDRTCSQPFSILRSPGIRWPIIATLFLTACRLRDPAYSEYDYAMPFAILPADSAFVGDYELDEYSYDRVDKTKAYRYGAALLTIRADGTFEVTNLPDMVFDTTGRPIKGQLLDASGTWTIPVPTSDREVDFAGTIVLRLTRGDPSGIPVTLTNDLRFRGQFMVIQIPVGPSKANEHLTFVKNTPHSSK